MKNHIGTLLLTGLLMFALLFAVSAVVASPTADCAATGVGADSPPLDFDITFNCTASQTVYFGVCDNGAALDDTYQILYKGSVVASNELTGGFKELVNIGDAVADAGDNTASFVVLSAPDNISTFAFAVSSSKSEVESFLDAECGLDVVFDPVTSSCAYTVNLFTEDGAPSNGTLEMHVLLGNEGARGDEQIYKVWDVNKGDQINNASVSHIPAPRYVRVWWQADGDSDWYMLTSQYYSGSGTLASEYGLECNASGAPSYHTSFASAIPESAVCFDPQTGCAPIK